MCLVMLWKQESWIISRCLRQLKAFLWRQLRLVTACPTEIDL